MARRFWLIVLAIGLVTAGLGARQGQVTTDLLKGLELRSIGPTLTTGRVRRHRRSIRRTRASGMWPRHSADSWKTTNRGITFSPIFDDNGVFTLCCVAIDPKDSNVVWLGTGENNSQRSAHFGDGIYKSTDAGKTWKRMGLEASEHIGEILDRSPQLERRVCRLAGPALLGGRRTRPLQDHRRRGHAGRRC